MPAQDVRTIFLSLDHHSEARFHHHRQLHPEKRGLVPSNLGSWLFCFCISRETDVLTKKLVSWVHPPPDSVSAAPTAMCFLAFDHHCCPWSIPKFRPSLPFANVCSTAVVPRRDGVPPSKTPTSPRHPRSMPEQTPCCFPWLDCLNTVSIF